MTASPLPLDADSDENVVVESGLAEELELIPAGAQLAARLAAIDRSRLDAEELLAVAAARQRLIAHQEAEFLADLHRVARQVPDYGPHHRRDALKYPWAEVETAAALRWSYLRAGCAMLFADELLERLPAVFEALHAGEIDVPKAKLLAEGTGMLDQQLARAVVDKLIDLAPRLTCGELRARLRKLVLAADPEAIAAKTRRDHTDRRVAGHMNRDSNLASLGGYELAPHRVAAVLERLDAIAKAAKAAGDTRRMDQLRADAYLDLLVGEGIAVGGPISRSGLEQMEQMEQMEPDPTPAPGARPDPATTGPATTDPAITNPASGSEEVPEPPNDIEAGSHRLCARCAAPANSRTGLPAPRRGVVDLQVPLTTLLGLAQLPGELDGWGPVIADLARQVVADLPEAQWRFSVYNKLGELTHHGITTARPTSRRPDAKTAGFVRARDRRCVAPGCRRTARVCDIDHTEDWVHGGKTETCNLGLLCKMHHLFKHSGCELIQIGPGRFVWNTPLGLQHTNTPDPPLIDNRQLADLPDPATILNTDDIEPSG